MAKYPHIFSPGRIGALEVKNRIKYAATETNFPFGDGFVSEKEIAYLEAQAHGGPGIVTTQGTYPDPKGEGQGFKGMMAIHDDRFIPGLARIAEVIKRHDALSCLQILHCGREGGVNLDYCLMPSVVPQRLSYFKPPREITVDEIKQSVDDHIKAARRAVEAGFDMIEISGIVGYLLSTFISRYTNKRSDIYGGDIRDRCRLMVEMLQGMKAEVGGKVPLGIRLCGTELLDDRGGNTLEESIESFKIAEEAGADYLSVTIGWHESSTPVITRDVPMGHWLWVAQKVKEAVKVPVMMAFRQFVPHIPEAAIGEGVIDFWEMCRPMIADPDMPRKIAEGREEDIIPCIACNVCFSRLYYHQPIMCSVRPSLGHEGEPRWGYYGFGASQERKKVVVIGGGPAGLQCAAVAAKKGHDVTLFEKNDSLGGSVLLAAKVDDGSNELLRPMRTLEVECEKAGVNIRRGVACTPALLAAEKSDIIVVATGAKGKDIPFVPPHMRFSPFEIINKTRGYPQRLAILGGSGVGLGVAVFLTHSGKYDLTIIEESGKLGRDVNPFYLWRYVRLLKEQKAAMILGASLIGMDDKGLRILGGKTGEKSIDVDGVVVALQEEDTEWQGLLNGYAKKIYVIGDAKRPRRIHNAIHDGYRVGMEIGQ